MGDDIVRLDVERDVRTSTPSVILEDLRVWTEQDPDTGMSHATTWRYDNLLWNQDDVPSGGDAVVVALSAMFAALMDESEAAASAWVRVWADHFGMLGDDASSSDMENDR